MSLSKGTMLGPYEVDVLLGAGGMGEVYRARDTRLDRTVAIKVLLSGLAVSDEARARFEREARAISALSNPHICALYDVGRADDAEYLVMEYLEGETLADRIARGPLPLTQVLRYGAQIADALQHAHRAGVMHRDLKPGNVMLTNAGVKLLDFGLAKLTSQQRVFSEDSAPATIVKPITAEGTVVGTMVYMSPEQLEGRNVDHRTDIFSLGVILYEMATGQRPFGGSSQLSIIAAILSSDPIPLRSLQPACPAALERIILTALEKNPDDRWQTAQDVGRQLRWLGDSSTSTEGLAAASAIPPPVPARLRRLLFLALPVAAAAGGLVGWGAMRLSAARAPAVPVTRLQLALTEDVRSVLSFESTNYALSPDGRMLCFKGVQAGTEALFLRRLDSFAVTKVAGTDGSSSPFWSSDGEWIGFSARGKLWKTNVGSSAVPQPLCDAGGARAVASWVGHTILFADEAGGRQEIYRASDQGGEPLRLTHLKANQWRHTWPRLLPDGRHFVYQAAIVNSVDRELILASLDSPESSVLLRNVSQVTLVRDDQLVYVRDAKLLVQRLDVRKGTMVGEPSLIADDVAYFYPSGRADFDAANGVVVYRTDTRTGRLVMTDRKGTARTIDGQTLFNELSLSYSRDGKRAAVTVLNRATGLGDIWIYDLVRAVRDRFTSDSGLALAPAWTPDGRSIIYSAAAAGALPHLVRRSLSGSAPEELMPRNTFQFAGSFSPDGSTLYFTQEFPQTSADIYRLDLRTRKAEPVIRSLFIEGDPQVSPDGQWLAFTSNVTGVSEVYLERLTARDVPRVRISTSGGNTPRWRRDGGELFYLSAEDGIESVVPRTAGDWSDTTVTELFHAPAGALRYDVSPDGQSFLFVEGASGAGDALFHVILGWQ